MNVIVIVNFTITQYLCPSLCGILHISHLLVGRKILMEQHAKRPSVTFPKLVFIWHTILRCSNSRKNYRCAVCTARSFGKHSYSQKKNYRFNDFAYYSWILIDVRHVYRGWAKDKSSIFAWERRSHYLAKELQVKNDCPKIPYSFGRIRVFCL